MSRRRHEHPHEDHDVTYENGMATCHTCKPAELSARRDVTFALPRPTSPVALPEMRPAEEWVREHYSRANRIVDKKLVVAIQADAFEAGRAAGFAEALRDAVWACELEKRSLDHVEDCGCRYVCDRCKTRIEALRPTTGTPPAEQPEVKR